MDNPVSNVKLLAPHSADSLPGTRHATLKDGKSWKYSRPASQSTSLPITPIMSSMDSAVDLAHETGANRSGDLAAATLERPVNKRQRSFFIRNSQKHQHPNVSRVKGSAHTVHLGDSAVPSNAIARLAQRTQNNLRMWYLRNSRSGSNRRRTELDNLREMEKSQMLFAQMFTVTPLVVLGASLFQADESNHRKVPVVLQQLSIRATEEPAKNYKNMIRIHLEYGSGLGMVKWEILRGYRDFLYLRAKLKSKNLHIISKKPKLPKLPRPKAFGYKDHKSKSREDSDSDFCIDEDDSADESEEDDEEIGTLNKPYRSEDFRFGSNSNSLERGSLFSPNIRQENTDLLSPNDERCLNLMNHSVRSRSHNSDTPYDSTCSRNSGPSNEIRKHHSKSYAAALESWLNRIKMIYALRSDSNDLMQFLELSHLSLKLASEYTFHGKEGMLIIRSRASELGWRVSHWHPKDLKSMVDRHTKKWVLVRDSYLVIVDNIYSTKIREVYLADSGFHVKHIHEKDSDASSNDLENSSKVYEVLPDAENVHKRPAAKSVFLHLKNNERDLKLAASSERDLRKWQASILQMKARTLWTKKHRFNSFAPVRTNVFGQWFVDGREYMWVLSEALENARDTIYILDWWLSPELYLRRPPEGNQKWRLDRVLKRKAQEGVKIFVIVYKNVGTTIPIDSMWTKYSLLDLHENVHVMRSPNQMSNSNALFWAHHEKLVIIDNTVAFNGGIDLCFGRWDTYQHVLTDDAPSAFLSPEPTSEEWGKKTQLFPGKDYSNARVKDFFDLNRPFDDMYDRNNVPRMPWHDVHQMVIGQPARDFARHFVQRWNYVLRQKIPSRSTPLLLPPSDLTTEDLDRLKLTGSCEYQVLRSSCEWSIGLKEHEQSIQNAYLQLIEESEHFVYIENQFFITSTKVDGIIIENQIGNALVQRIIRAHEQKQPWKAFILIPLLPGFEADVDSDKASSVRIICQCQFNSISRGPHSIFYRLERLGIRPDQYIHFFSLRKWGKFSDTKESPNDGRLVTELLYIHAKCLIVDDRIAVIGSANINERSMRGVRDSEVAVCVRDTKVVHTTMAGKTWKAGRFAHTLRLRLMREHLGVDIDKVEIVERYMTALDDAAKKAFEVKQNVPQQYVKQASATMNSTDEFSSNTTNTKKPSKDLLFDSQHDNHQYPEWLYPELHSFNWYAGTNINPGVRDHKKLSSDSRIHNNSEHYADVNGEGVDHSKIRETQTEKNKERLYMAAFPDLESEKKARDIVNELLNDISITSREQFRKVFYARLTGQDILRPLRKAVDLPMPQTDEDGLKAVNNENIPIDPWLFNDPLDERFVNDMWLAAAERNTLIFRLVFRCQPDDEVETWKDYKLFANHLEVFYRKQKEDGGPNTLRRTGNHEPERVDKYFLEGAASQSHSESLFQGKSKHTSDSFVSKDVNNNLNGKQNGHAFGAELNDDPTEKLNSFQINSENNGPSDDYFTHKNSVYRSNSASDGNDLRDKYPKDGKSNSVHNTKDGTPTLAHEDQKVASPDVDTTSSCKRSISAVSTRKRSPTITGVISNAKPSRKWDHFEHVLDAKVAEDMLQGVTGHLVVFPTEWLNRELDSDNWNFQLDRIAPLEIYD